jgi:hypothetical protein
MSNTTTALALPDQIAALDRLAEEKNIVALQEQGVFAAAISMASAISDLRKAIGPEIMKPIMELQGTSLGFRTDKDKEGGYKEEVVKEAFIEATLRGFKPVGNQLNIISGRFYATKEGFEARFRELSAKGLITDMKLHPTVPRLTGDGAIVVYSASWKWKGKPDSIENLEIPVKVNGGMGADAILGKAKRKILAAIYSRVTGSEVSDGDASDPAINVQATPVVEAKTQTAGLDAALVAELEAILVPHEEAANKYLVDSGTIQPGKTFREIPEVMARRIIKNRDSFFKAIGAK